MISTISPLDGTVFSGLVPGANTGSSAADGNNNNKESPVRLRVCNYNGVLVWI